ncbi:DUF6368 family protein [Streptomyces sp. NPDC051917]|uniref:DUF6368 family protein n=1 Tax=Streptomyces sp. NPDC051917 TaxID=3154754 RepID=UPI00344D7234
MHLRPLPHRPQHLTPHHTQHRLEAELLDGQASVVAGLRGVLGITDDEWTVLGTADFLRAWAAQPGFRLVK